FVGNPYPSHVDLREFFDTNTSVEAQALFYEKDPTSDTHIINEIRSGFGVWVPNGGDNIPNNTVYIGTTGNTDSGVFTRATYTMYDLNGNPTGGPQGYGLD